MRIIKNLTFLCVLLCVCSFFIKAENNGLADAKAIVHSPNVRFTILTSGLIRMEWDSLEHFNDDPSFVFINRKLPVPDYKVSKRNGWLFITTDKVELKYKINSGKFNATNLVVKYLDKIDMFNWNPGMKQTNNLKGTARTLDAFNGDVHRDDGHKLELEDGLLSTDGWTLIDDSKSLLFDNSEWAWAKLRVESSAQDWYFFAYGKNYKSTLYDFSLVAGKVPLPPRYVFGYWWSRYWSYSDNELRALVLNYEKYNLPLDVLVIDINWHYTDSLNASKDEFGEKKQWTGWTWNKRLFPDPEKFLRWAKTKDLKITLNLHPASGVAPFDPQYEDFAGKMNFDTSSKRNIPYVGSDKKFIETLFSEILHPMEKQGVDFWWLDWQQWKNDKKIESLNNTWWLNYLFFSDMERSSDKRPLLYHRWGGLGNHRYQIGFSGDAIISWQSLAYQPYFTNCASNVLYGFWSHDLGGHMFAPGMKFQLDPELYVRWMQYGVFSPVFRTHSTKQSVLNKEPWVFNGEYFNAIEAAINLRYRLAPYIYTMARKTYDEGLSVCRPMYYDYPRNEKAYDYKLQYMFGDNIVIAPVIAPMENGISKLKIWLPESNDWFEWNTGTLLAGGQEIEREFSLDEYPVYIKSGTIIPMYSHVKNLAKEPYVLEWAIFPGNEGAASLYQDAGDSKNYDREFATTGITSKTQDRTQKIIIEARKGSYSGMPNIVNHVVKLYGVEMPEQIILDGESLTYSFLPEKNKWFYNGNDLSVNIVLPESDCTAEHEIVVKYNPSDRLNVNTGIVKEFKELTRLVKQLKYKRPGWEITDTIGNCETTNLKLGYEPQNFYNLLRYHQEHYDQAVSEIKNYLNNK